MLFGGSGHAAPPPAEAQAPVNQAQEQQWQGQGASCEIQAKGKLQRLKHGLTTDFTKCLDATNDVQSCSYYLEALSASTPRDNVANMQRLARLLLVHTRVLEKV